MRPRQARAVRRRQGQELRAHQGQAREGRALIEPTRGRLARGFCRGASFAPALTNLSCIATLPGLTADAPRRLVAADAGNRRVGVFDLPPGGARPVPVAGSPFALTETPAELAAGIAVLSPL